jgi:hypothetical protein
MSNPQLVSPVGILSKASPYSSCMRVACSALTFLSCSAHAGRAVGALLSCEAVADHRDDPRGHRVRARPAPWRSKPHGAQVCRADSRMPANAAVPTRLRASNANALASSAAAVAFDTNA